jgi:acyl-CoA thioester hydrolase
VERYARTFTVRWADCDANGHVRNTCYSELAIEVRMAFLTEHGFGFGELVRHGVGPVLLREEIDYLRECHLGEALKVDFTSLGLSEDGTRFKLGHDVWKPDGRQAARLVIHGGWMDMKARRLAPPPPALRQIMEQVERAEGFETLRSVGGRG